jgi:hypothetical protein
VCESSVQVVSERSLTQLASSGIDMRTTLMIKVRWRLSALIDAGPTDSSWAQNIPNKMKDFEVMAFIDEASPRLARLSALPDSAPGQVVGRAYDFFYLRCDYSNGCNVGCEPPSRCVCHTVAHLLGSRRRLRQLHLDDRPARVCQGSTRHEVEQVRFGQALRDELRQHPGALRFCARLRRERGSFGARRSSQGKASLIAHFKNSSVLDQDESRRPKLFVSSGPHAGEPEAFPGPLPPSFVRHRARLTPFALPPQPATTRSARLARR